MLITYTVDYSLWGLNPFGFHLTNVLIHLIASLILLSLLFNLFGKYKHGVFASLIGASIFAVHTIHTEAVSWVSGRTDSLATLFFFASFLFYIKFSGTEYLNNRLLYFSLLFYIIGLLSKEMVVTLPVIILIYDLIYRKEKLEIIKKNIRIYVYFILLTFLFLFIRYLTLKNVPDRDNYLYFYGKETIIVIATMLKTIPVYFKLLFYPVDLLYHYNGVIPDSNSFFEPSVIFAIILIFALLALAFWFYKKHNIISFAILFFFISLLPVMNIIPTMNFMAERFLYITSFALSLVVSYLLSVYFKKNNSIYITTLSILFVFIFSFLTYNRNKDWKDNNTLYSSADGKDGSVLLVNAGNVYANKKQFEEAEKRYKKAIEIRDNSVLAHHNLGLIYLIRNQFDSAEIQIKKGISIDTLAPDGYFQLANIYQQQGRIDEAVFNLEKLQEILPDYRGSLAQLNMLRSGNKQENTDKGNELSVLDKKSFQLYQEKKYNEAIIVLEKMITISPSGKPGYLNNIALCYEGLKNNIKAKDTYREAIKLDDKNVNSMNGLASILLKEGKKSEAKELYRKILLVNPNDGNAISKLDSLK